MGFGQFFTDFNNVFVFFGAISLCDVTTKQYGCNMLLFSLTADKRCNIIGVKRKYYVNPEGEIYGTW